MKRHVLNAALTTAAAMTALSAVLVAPAQAGSTAAPTPLGGKDVSSTQVPVVDAAGNSRMLAPAAADKAIKEFWTEERKASAKPVPLPRERRGTTVAPAPRGKLPAQQTLARPATAKRSAAGTAAATRVTPTVGSVYFIDPSDGYPYVCSGSAVNAAGARLVLTAGHCLHTGPRAGQWMQNWMFQPAYHDGESWPGTFTSAGKHAKTGWTRDENRSFDYGFAVVNDNQHGQRLGDVVGGNGLVINAGYPYATFIGYPWNVGGTERQSSCSGQLRRHTSTDRDPAMNCNIGQGGSGGPFLRDYDDAAGTGNIVSVVSWGPNPDPQAPTVGPYLDDAMRSLFDKAVNASLW